jgi:dihydroorotate dehydrogenase
MRFLVGPIASCLETRAFGLTFSSPLGVAAGLDKDASWFEDLAALGFGFVEVGTITAQAQEGNAPPRLIRLAQEGALVNRMGFPNPGAAVAAGRLARRGPGPVVGVNIGKSMAVPVEDAIADYRAAASTLASVSDYIVLNVSSPNTEGLRALQATEPLRSLITAVRNELAAIGCARPLLIKVGPDLEDEEIDGIVAVALEVQLDGIVAVNTTVDRSALTEASARVASLDAGGVSGAPLRARAMEVLRRIRRLANDRLVLVSVGGVGGAEDVWERIRAGATLVQVYTAFIYEGPAWPRRVNRELARRVREAGVSSIGEMIGAEERGPHGRGDLSPQGSEPSRGGQRGDGGSHVQNEASATQSRRQ